MKRPKDRLHRVIVVGATPAGIVATNKLGELGIPVTLIDTDSNIDQKLSRDEWKLKTGMQLNHAHRPGLIRIFRNRGIKCIMPAEVKSIKHNLQGFRVSLVKKQTFIDSEKCTLCGRCVEVCPVQVGENEKAIKIDSRLNLPGRPEIDKRRLPLCLESCPLGVNAQGYIALAKEGKFIEGLELVREKNILPGICGRICTHPCEEDCRRGELDDAVSIRSIKRFLADYETEHAKEIPFEKHSNKIVEARKEKIAIVGSGPSALAAAAELAGFGCRVTVFEKQEKLGGLLRYGIGPHRLPRNILDAELKYIEKLGVNFITSHRVDLKEDPGQLRNEFDGVILCTGTWKDRKLGVPGEDMEGVESCLSFLNRFYHGGVEKIKEKVAVIGDGNAAYDLARTLFRSGADVTIVSWFKKDKIPADLEEIDAADEEGIKTNDSTQVVGFLGKNNRFRSLLCRSTRPGKPDDNGIVWPVIIEDKKPFELEFDKVFVAIGQVGSLEENSCDKGLKISEAGFIKTDEDCRTDMLGIYAAGDVVTGPSSVVHSMAEGKRVAHRVLNDVCGLQIHDTCAERPRDKDFPEISKDIPNLRRAVMPKRRIPERRNNFSEVELGFSESRVIYESERCLQCGVCSECLQCVDVCKAIGAIDHGESEEGSVEHAGVVIIADSEMAPQVRGDDVIRAYGPKFSKTDVYAMIMRGFASAANAMVLLKKTMQRQKGHGFSYSQPEPGLSPDIRIGVFACRCNDSIGWLDGMDSYVENLIAVKNVVHCEVIPSACVPEGISIILKSVREKGITRIALASCVCCPLDFVCSACTDQRSRLKSALFTATGISRSMVVTCDIRGEALSLIKKDSRHAMARFEGLISRSIRSAERFKLFPSPMRNYNFTTAVIGKSEAVVTSAMTLAKADMDVYFFGPEKIIPEHPNVHCFEGASVNALSGTLGDFQVKIKSNNTDQKIHVGAVIIGEKSRKKIKYIHQESLPSRIVASSMQTEGTKGIPFFYPGMTSISGLFLADPPGINISNRKKGAAVAALAAAVMPRGPRHGKGYTVVIDEDLCRSCGRCIEVCLYQAITLKKNSTGVWYASVDEAFCKGCGNCISVCPSNAADSPYRNQAFLEQILEEILLQ